MRLSAIVFTPAITPASSVRPVEREILAEPSRVEIPARQQRSRSDGGKAHKAPARPAAARSSSAVQAALVDLRPGG